VELAIYDWVKKQLICRFNSSDTIGTHFISSFTAGFAGALASTPIDVVRVSENILFILLICLFLSRLV
jgi:solute carrier family 25 protein 14/30